MAARDIHGPQPPWGEEFRVVGRAHRKVDGLSKATGRALYADDIALPGMLHAKTLRSPVSLDSLRGRLKWLESGRPSTLRRRRLSRCPTEKRRA